MKKLHSGGARGSDLAFTRIALQNDYIVDIHSFKDHKIVWPLEPLFNNSYTIIHDKEELKEAMTYLKEANKTLKRKIPPVGYIRNLLCRNYYQIKDTECVLAVGAIDRDDKIVKGGTGWAVQMAVDKKLPIYVFNQSNYRWYYYNYISNFFVANLRVPNDINKYTTITGIGTREIDTASIKAIEMLFVINK